MDPFVDIDESAEAILEMARQEEQSHHSETIETSTEREQQKALWTLEEHEWWRTVLRESFGRISQAPRPLPPNRLTLVHFVQSIRSSLEDVQRALKQCAMQIPEHKTDSERSLLEQLVAAAASTSILELKSRMILCHPENVVPRGYQMIYEQMRVFSNAIFQQASLSNDLSNLLKEYSSAANQLSLEWNIETFLTFSELSTHPEYVKTK